MGAWLMTQYRTFRTTMGHKVRMRMTRQEIKERRIMTALIVFSPFAMCWLFAIFARMV